MAHALTTDTGECHFDAAAIADNALMLNALVFTASTLPVTGRSKDTLAEEAALFWFERTVVNGFRVLDFSRTPGADTIRRGDTDRHRVELLTGGFLPEDFFQARVSIHRHRFEALRFVIQGWD